MLQKVGLDEAHDKAHQVTAIERLAVKAETGKTLPKLKCTTAF